MSRLLKIIHHHRLQLKVIVNLTDLIMVLVNTHPSSMFREGRSDPLACSRPHGTGDIVDIIPVHPESTKENAQTPPTELGWKSNPQPWKCEMQRCPVSCHMCRRWG